MPESTLKVRQDIQARIPAYGNNHGFSFLSDKVGRYLSDSDQVKGSLLALERAMDAEAGNRLKGPVNLGTAQTALRTRAPGVKAPPYLQNLLSTVLSRMEQANGFKLGKKDRPWSPNQPVSVMLTGFAAPVKFRSMLQQRLPFKDPTVPGGHGEFSHRIQWYCMMSAGPPLSLPAGKSWGDYYEWVGGMVHTAAVGGDLPGWSELGLWDALFDRNKNGRVNGPYNTSSPTDYRSPENLHEDLTTKHTATYPLLATFLDVREAKRENSQIRINSAKQSDYVAKKIFGPGVTYAALSNQDKARVQGILDGKIFTPQPISPQTADPWFEPFITVFRWFWP